MRIEHRYMISAVAIHDFGGKNDAGVLAVEMQKAAQTAFVSY